MSDSSTLHDTAVDLCRQLVQPSLGSELRIDVDAVSTDWHGTLLRNVHSQAMTVWRRFGRFLVTVDGAGRVIGYADEDAYTGSDDTTTLSDLEIEHLIADDPAIPGRTKLLSAAHLPTPHGGRMVRARCRLAVPTAAYEELSVEINPARRLVAMVRPEFLDPEEQP